MKCPKCASELSTKAYLGIEVDQCDNCKGMWLDLQELDQLEDEAFDEDKLKGSLMYSSATTNYLCPHCGSQLRQFEYRATSLKLDYCEAHGYWLDAGEGERVLQLMKDREKDMHRKFEAEAEWARTLRQFRSRSFWSKLQDLFKK